MERIIRTLLLLLKKNLTNVGYVLTLIFLFSLLILSSQVHLPTSDNCIIGIYTGASDIAGKSVADLTTDLDSHQSIILYENRDALKNDVKSGSLDCGFIFSDDFDKLLKKGHLKNSIDYISSPYTTQGMLFQENIYAHLFRYYSDEILISDLPKYYDSFTSDMKEDILRLNSEQLNDGGLFSVHIEGLQENNRLSNTTKESNKLPLILSYFIVFICVFLSVGEKWNTQNNIVMALNQKEALAFRYLELISAGLFPAIITCILNHNISYTINVLLLLVFGSLWCLIFSVILKNQLTYLAMIPSVIILNMAVCPLIIDLSIYIKAIQYIKYLFPLGWL